MAKKNKSTKEMPVPIPQKKKRGEKIFLIIALILAIICLLSSIGTHFLLFKNNNENNERAAYPAYYYPSFVSFNNKTFVLMYVPAVNDNGKGVITTLGVEAMPGSGKVLVDIDNLVFWDDTQTSIRTAKTVTHYITNKDINKYDLVYAINTNASMIGGPSAGAAIAIATIAAIENKKLRDDVMITGAISPDGSIEPVSAVSAKAAAAKQINMSLFLVPPGQSTEIVYDITKKCSMIDNIEYCSIEQVPRKIDISKEVGIKIVEVSTVEEALKYFFY